MTKTISVATTCKYPTLWRVHCTTPYTKRACQTLKTAESSLTCRQAPQFIKKFPTFCRTRRYITLFTTARSCMVSWDSWIQSTHSPPPSFLNINFTTPRLLHPGLISRLFLTRFPNTQHAVRATCPCHHPSLISPPPPPTIHYLLKNTSYGLFIMQFSPSSCFFMSRGRSRFKVTAVYGTPLQGAPPFRGPDNAFTSFRLKHILCVWSIYIVSSIIHVGRAPWYSSTLGREIRETELLTDVNIILF
jgi:hypothetical protein